MLKCPRAIRIASAIPQAAMQIRANLRLPLAKPLAERGISAFGGLAGFYANCGYRLSTVL